MTVSNVDISTSSQETLRHGEKVCFSFLCIFSALTVYLTVYLDRAVDWGAFAVPVLAGFFTIGLGIFTRVARGMDRIASLLIGTSIYLSFGAFVSIYIYLFMPIWNAPIDDLLFVFDSKVGFVWSDFVASFENVPAFARSLVYVYHSSFAQMIVVLMVLAGLNRARALNLFVLTTMVSLFVTATFWAIFPSFGPAAYQILPSDIENSLNIFTGAAYGESLMAQAELGVPVISPGVILGSIAFPSFHMIMACLVVWFLRTTFAFYPAVILNTLMLPSILIHGGHHLVDLLGGIIAFFIALGLSAALMAWFASETDTCTT